MNNTNYTYIRNSKNSALLGILHGNPDSNQDQTTTLTLSPKKHYPNTDPDQT